MAGFVLESAHEDAMEIQGASLECLIPWCHHVSIVILLLHRQTLPSFLPAPLRLIE